MEEIKKKSMKPKPNKKVKKTKICVFWEKTGECPNGLSCNFAHGKEELVKPKSKPNRDQQKKKSNKAQLCNNWVKDGYCPLETCKYAHGEEELRNLQSRSKPIDDRRARSDQANTQPQSKKSRSNSRSHSKTRSRRDKSRDNVSSTSSPKSTDSKSNRLKIIPCRFYLEGTCTRGDDCNFAHQGKVVPKKANCIYWKLGTCTKGSSCLYSHGIKDVENRKSRSNTRDSSRSRSSSSSSNAYVTADEESSNSSMDQNQYPDNDSEMFDTEKEELIDENSGVQAAQIQKNLLLIIKECKGLWNVIQTFYEKHTKEKNDTIQQQVKILGKIEVDIKNMSAYFPVYGVTKAGKSTFLSFLLRESILPSRTLPMTTIPIKIGHKPNEKKTLKIPNWKSWNTLVKHLYSINKTLKVETHHEELVSRLNNISFTEITQDDKLIVQHLMDISDLARLCIQNKISLEKFHIQIDIDELPQLTMDMIIFRGSSVKNFFFIDTPGPNESGISTALNKITIDTLSSSCGTIFVVPPDHIDSTDNAVLFEHLSANYKGKKIITILNKIDSVTKASEIPQIEKKILSNFSHVINTTIIPTSGSSLVLLHKLKDCLKTNKDPRKQEFYHDLLDMFHIQESKINDIVQYLKNLVATKLKQYNSDLIMKAMKSLYYKSECISLSSQTLNIFNSIESLERNLEVIVSLTGIGQGKQQLNKDNQKALDLLLQIENELQQIPKSLDMEFSNIITNDIMKPIANWGNDQNDWIIVDQHGNQKEVFEFHSPAGLKDWYRTQSDIKVIPLLQAIYNSSIENAQKKCDDLLKSKYSVLQKHISSLKSISAYQNSHQVQNFLTYTAPPKIEFPTHKATFSVELLPCTKTPDGKTLVYQRDFCPAMLKEFICQTKEYSDNIKATFTAKTSTVIKKLQNEISVMCSEAKELKKKQDSLEKIAKEQEEAFKQFTQINKKTLSSQKSKLEDAQAQLELLCSWKSK